MSTKHILSDRRSFLSSLFLGLLFALSGCDTTGSFINTVTPGSAATPAMVTAKWEPFVITTADCVHQGAKLPGIAGRVYLFEQELGRGRPVIGDGSMIFGLYDDTPRADGAGPVELEEWKIDAATLHRLAKDDMIGPGYTVFLPWNTYKPDINHVVMKIRYDQANKPSLFSESKLTLDADTTLPQVLQTTKMPGKQ